MRFASWESNGTVRGVPPAPPRTVVGDLAEMSAAGPGSLANQVTAGQSLPPVRPARPRSRSRIRS
jgi:hypothetical protein